MKKQIFIACVILGAVLAAALLFFKIKSVKKTESAPPNFPSTFIEQPEGELPKEKQEQKKDIQTSENQAFKVIRECAQQMDLDRLQLMQPADQMEDLLRMVQEGQKWTHTVELENLHFTDAQGQPLRFQILSPKESRFFRVDAEGLPIRIETPPPYQGKTPMEQKEALLNDFKKPVFDQKKQRDDSESLSIQSIVENGRVTQVQVFQKSSQGKVHSLACAQLKGQLSCQCL